MGGHLNRRTAILAIGAAGAIAAIPVAAIAGIGTTADRTAWDRAFAAMTKAKASSDAASRTFDTAWTKWQAACETIPHVTLGPDPYLGRSEPVSTTSDFLVKCARQTTRGNTS